MSNFLPYYNYSEKLTKKDMGSFSVREKEKVNASSISPLIKDKKSNGSKNNSSSKKKTKNNTNPINPHKASFPDIESCLSPTLIKEIEEKEMLERRKDLLQSSPNLKELAERILKTPTPNEMNGATMAQKYSMKDQAERPEKYFINPDEKL